MLKEFLPQVKQRFLKQKRDQENPDLSASPNLVVPFYSEFSAQEKAHSRFILFFKVFIVGLPAVFVFVLLLNDIQDFRIKAEQNRISDIEAKITDMRDVEKEATWIWNKVNFYKKIKREKFSVGDRTNLIMSNLPNDMSLLEFKTSSNSTSIEAQSANVVSFSTFITRVLSDKTVSEIVLKAADLNTSKDVFSAAMEVVFNK
jgi:hypothetical protein